MTFTRSLFSRVCQVACGKPAAVARLMGGCLCGQLMLFMEQACMLTAVEMDYTVQLALTSSMWSIQAECFFISRTSQKNFFKSRSEMLHPFIFILLKSSPLKEHLDTP